MTDANAGTKETRESGGKKYVELKRQHGDKGRGDSVGDSERQTYMHKDGDR